MGQPDLPLAALHWATPGAGHTAPAPPLPHAAAARKTRERHNIRSIAPTSRGGIKTPNPRIPYARAVGTPRPTRHARTPTQKPTQSPRATAPAAPDGRDAHGIADRCSRQVSREEAGNERRRGGICPSHTRLPRRAAARSSWPAGRGRRVARESRRGGAGRRRRRGAHPEVGYGSGGRGRWRSRLASRGRRRREKGKRRGEREREVLDPWKVPGLVRRLAGQERCAGGRLG